MNTPNQNLTSLRKSLETLGVSAILVSMKCSFDNYDSDYSDIRNISGFSGSNGRAIVSSSRAILSVDGRYTTQAARQVDNSLWEIEQYPECDTLGMVKKLLSTGETVAISSVAHSYKSFISLKSQLEAAGYNVLAIDEHPILLFRENPAYNNEILVTDTSYINERVKEVTKNLTQDEVLLIANKETISWIFGIRKSIIGHDKGPVANALALLTKTQKPILFSDLPTEVNEFFHYYQFKNFKEVMNNFRNLTIKASYSSVPAYFISTLFNGNFKVLPTQHNYATLEHLKTFQEIEDQKAGSLETSKAFIKALSYIDYYVRKGEKITEQDAISYFESKEAIDYSFNPICASAENTSIVHYNPKTWGNSIIKNNSLFLFDAGFHFKNSSTDMTRTIYIGDNPSEDFKLIYTTILKAFIHYSMCKFQNNTYACALDAICRYHLWQNNMDYSFGTGHGVGNFRSVHEGPHISSNSSDKITSAMITTVEPGYYTENFGIRLENMLLTSKIPESNMIQFETITHIPFCNSLIDKNLLDKDAISWLNEYHSNISRTFLPVFKNDPITTSWIIQNTKIL